KADRRSIRLRGRAVVDARPHATAPRARADGANFIVAERGVRRRSASPDDATDEQALAAVFEEAAHGVRQELRFVECAAKPADIFVVARDEARLHCPALRFAEHGGNARRHAFDRLLHLAQSSTAYPFNTRSARSVFHRLGRPALSPISIGITPA